MNITTSQHGAWTVLSPAGKLDNLGAEELEKALLPLLNGGSVALDFTQVEYVTSSGFRVLMVALKQQMAKSGRLEIVGLSAPVLRFFAIAGLDRTFRLKPGGLEILPA
jgi:anti-sigma B factor antagonist